MDPLILLVQKSCLLLLDLGTSFTDDEHDNLSMEFRDFRSCSDSELPQFHSTNYAAIEHYRDAMSKVKLVTDINTSRFGTLAQFAKILLVLPHSNADPERLFSMVRKIETEQRKHLDPSTVRDLLSIKLNNSTPCFENDEH